ncbi:MAG: hypothetical protein AB7V55_07945, partial [Oscillospiraceae bacterium]
LVHSGDPNLQLPAGMRDGPAPGEAPVKSPAAPLAAPQMPAPANGAAPRRLMDTVEIPRLAIGADGTVYPGEKNGKKVHFLPGQRHAPAPLPPDDPNRLLPSDMRDSPLPPDMM